VQTDFELADEHSTPPRAGQETRSANGPGRPTSAVFRRRRLAVGSLAVLVLLCVLFAADRWAHSGQVARNVRVGGIDVGGLQRNEAAVVIASRGNDLLNSRITVEAGERTMEFLPAELGVTIDADATADAALAAGGGWNPLAWLAGWISDTEVPFEGVTVSPTRVRDRIGPSFQDVQDPAQDARFVVEGDTVRIEPSHPGHGLDVEQAQEAIAAAAVAGGPARTAVIPLSEVEPQLTTGQAEAMGIHDKLGTFTTKFPAGEPRVKNIERIAAMVDSTAVQPGERFSVNDHVGPRTEEAGFIRAPVIYDGEMSDDIGGGISQFGTTLFNAVYFAGLPIEEFKAHSFWISRYPLGRESTLSYPHPDVAFVNDYAQPILLKVEVAKAQITVSLFGTSDGRKVSTSTADKRDPRPPTTQCEKDTGLKAGTEKVKQKPDWGYSVEFTRTITRADGNSESRTFTTTYEPKDRVILYNPAPAPTTSAVTTTTAPQTPDQSTPPTTTTSPPQTSSTSTGLCPAANGTQPELAAFDPKPAAGTT